MDRRSFVTGLAVGGAVGAGAASLLTKPKEIIKEVEVVKDCLLYTSDAADEL